MPKTYIDESYAIAHDMLAHGDIAADELEQAAYELAWELMLDDERRAYV